MNEENIHKHVMKDAESYDRFIEEKLVRTYPQTARRIICEYGITEGRCLDIGCGTGRLEIELAKISKLQIIGLDINPSFVGFARKKVCDASLSDRVKFLAGDVHYLPFWDNSVDLIISRGSLPAWTDRVRAFQEIYRVLKTGGLAFLGGRYLYAPEEYKITMEELRDNISKTGIPDIKVTEMRGQWVEIRGPDWDKRPAYKPPTRRMDQLTGRITLDYDITEGLCVDIGPMSQLDIELAKITQLQIVGLAYSEEQAADASAAVKEHGFSDRISYTVWDASTIPFDDGEVALVVCVGPSLVHLKNRGRVFKEMNRILQPGGVGFLGGRYLPWPQERKERFIAELTQAVADANVPQLKLTHDDWGIWLELRKPIANTSTKPWP